MWANWVSNPGSLALESYVLSTKLHSLTKILICLPDLNTYHKFPKNGIGRFFNAVMLLKEMKMEWECWPGSNWS